MADETPPQKRKSPRPLSIGLFWFTTLLTATALVTGCVSPQAQLPWGASHSPPQSPTTQSLYSQSDPFQITPNDREGVAIGTTPTLDEQSRRRLDAPNAGADRSHAGSESGREGPGSDGIQSARLSLLIETPESAAVDDFVAVRIKVENASDTPAEHVTVTCQFDEHLEFSGSSEPAVRQLLGRIAPGDSRELVLSLTARKEGRGCVQLHIASDTHVDTTTERCLDIDPPASVAVSIVGPRRRTVGSRAEYVITFINDSGSDLPAANVSLTYHPALRLKEVSAGAQREPGLLRWDLGTLFEDERIQIQVEFECESAVQSAPLIATVTSIHNASGGAEASLTVSARPDLELRLSDMADPLEFGQQSTFLLEVENHSSEPAHGIVIHLVPSGNIKINGAMVRHGSRELDLDVFVEETGLHFAAAAPLVPGELLTCEIEFEVLAAGTSELRAILQSRNLTAPPEVREPIVINPPLTNY